MALVAGAGGQPAPLGVAAVVGMAFNTARASRTAVMLSLLCLGLQYAWPTPTAASLVPLAPLYAAGFVLAVELAGSSLDLDAVADLPAEVVAWRLRRAGLLAVGAIVCAVVVLTFAALPVRGGLVRAVGVGVAVAGWSALLVLTRRRLHNGPVASRRGMIG
jgi:hypothetical protein